MGSATAVCPGRGPVGFGRGLQLETLHPLRVTSLHLLQAEQSQCSRLFPPTKALIFPSLPCTFLASSVSSFSSPSLSFPVGQLGRSRWRVTQTEGMPIPDRRLLWLSKKQVPGVWLPGTGSCGQGCEGEMSREHLESTCTILLAGLLYLLNFTPVQRQCRQRALPGCGPRGLFKCLPSRLKSFRDLSMWFLQVQPSWLFVAVQGACQMTLVVAVVVDAIVIIFIFIKLRNTCQGVI